MLFVVLFFELLYCFVAFTNIPAISNLRERFIMTALETNSHQWLAERFFPKYMVDEIKMKREYSQTADDMESERPAPTESTVPPETEEIPTESLTEPTEPDEDAAETAFYELFWELNRTSFEEYLREHRASVNEDVSQVLFDCNWKPTELMEQAEYCLQIICLPEENLYLRKAEVLVFDGEAELFRLTVAGQKGGIPDEDR